MNITANSERGIIMSKKLYKKSEGQLICGVCNGLGDYLNLDPNLVRIGAVVLACGSAGIVGLAYLVAAVILPEK